MLTTRQGSVLLCARKYRKFMQIRYYMYALTLAQEATSAAKSTKLVYQFAIWATMVIQQLLYAFLSAQLKFTLMARIKQEHV